MVEDGGLQQVLGTILQNAEHKLPCRRIIDKMLTDMHSTKMESVKESVKNRKSISLAPDYWTSIGNENYCGIISHMINDD